MSTDMFDELDSAPDDEAYSEDIDESELLDEDLSLDETVKSEEDDLDFSDPYWQELVGEINRAIRATAIRPYIPEEDVDA